MRQATMHKLAVRLYNEPYEPRPFEGSFEPGQRHVGQPGKSPRVLNDAVAAIH